jgi:lauroyl/myristoyl acyltransferase
MVCGTIEWALRPKLRQRLATNLAHAVAAPVDSSDVRRTVRQEILNEARRSADLLWAVGKPSAFLDTVRVDGAQHVAEAAGLILAGIHIGGWEVATPIPAVVVPVPTTVITADDWLAWGIDHVRAAAGLRTIRAGRTLEALRVLRRGECLLLLGDHALDPSTRLLPVEFCGNEAHLPTGVVVLSRLARSPIVSFDVLPIGPRRWCVTIGPPIEPPVTSADDRVVLQELADRWTTTVRAHPEQWAARFPIAWASEP